MTMDMLLAVSILSIWFSGFLTHLRIGRINDLMEMRINRLEAKIGELEVKLSETAK